MTATEITGPPVTAPAVASPRPAEARGPRTLPRWPLILIAAPAAVAVWSGWVGLGLMCGFGVVHPLPGIVNGFSINTAIAGRRTWSTAWGIRIAPWPVVTFVSCLPVLTLGSGAALTHLLRAGHVPPAAEAEAASAAATDPDTAPATAADSTPDTPADTAPDITPAPKRTPARTRRGPSTAARVAAMRDKHPDMPVADIAARLKVSDRTVRRYLSPPATDAPQPIAA